MSHQIIQRELLVAISSFDDALHPILKKIYSARGVQQAQELQNELKHLATPEKLSGIEKASEIIAASIAAQEKILILGDFDTDGATSSVLALSALKAFGAKEVNYLVPNRFEFGYGLTPEIVAVAKEGFAPDLIITVDNGISSIDGVLAANKHGMKVVITDHHLQGHELPQAAAIVNPNQHGDAFLSKNLAGVGVIFYVMCALRRKLEQLEWFKQQNITSPNMGQFLDLVALGTFADVVPLDHNNRIMVQQGINRIRAANCRPGIMALLEVSKRNHEKISS